jgi:uncharacterized protein
MQFAPKKPVPVFPLPNLVLFPRIVVPLHVFELRYRTMVREALSSERLIALALLKPGWERDYHGSPEFHPLACLATFQEVEWLPNDCYDLQLLGVSRVQLGGIVREYPYRSVKAAVLPEEPYTEGDPLVDMERGALAETLGKWLSTVDALEGVSPPGPPDRLGYELLVNYACMSADLAAEEKLRLLEVDSLIERGHRIGELLERRLKRATPRVGPGGERN